MSERLSRAGIEHIVCVATGYGELVMQKDGCADIRQGRLTENEMETLIAGEAETVFDATHPYATAVSENIRGACARAGAEYVRVLRSSVNADAGETIRTFEDARACAEALKETRGNILLTTGSKELGIYAADPSVRDRLFVRVLPSEESIGLCARAGISARQVIAMQGPFTKEMDLATIRQFEISTVVTKASGRAGGFEEKLEAAAEAGTACFVIGRPAEESGVTADEALRAHFGLTPVIHVDLIATGPGRGTLLTEEARDAVNRADIICGAERMIRPYPHKRRYPKYLAKDIIPVIEREHPERMAVLFSGDTGFCSGAAKMKPALEEWLSENGYEFEIKTHAGISSFAYLAAAAGEVYSGAKLCSMHGRPDDGRNLADILAEIGRNGRTVVIMSGPEDAVRLGKAMTENGLECCRVILGRDLSYPDEAVIDTDPARCMGVTEPGLYLAMIINSSLN